MPQQQFQKYGILFLAALFLFVLDGCSTSSPRFRTRTAPRSVEQKPPSEKPRFSSKEKEAETERREDDKKVDSTEVENIKAGKRDFRKEKNAAIKPLDQSKMMREISKYMGTPYVPGGTTKDGMDCSGYTMVVYKNAMNINLPRSSAEQFKVGRAVSYAELKFGDLVFFNTTGESASHVGIYLGDDLFAHASVSLGVTISSLQSSYYQKRFEGARRIIE